MELFCYTQNYAVSQGFQLKPSPSRKENPKPKKEKVTDFCTYYVLLLNLLLTWKRAPNWILLLNFLVVLVTKGQTLRDVWNWTLIDIRQTPRFSEQFSLRVKGRIWHLLIAVSWSSEATIANQDSPVTSDKGAF